MHRLEAIERLHPELQGQDSPTLTVGAASGTLFAPVEHAERMLSLDNVFSDEEFLAWAAKVERDAGRPVHYLCELKIDGLALSLRYERGRLDVGGDPRRRTRRRGRHRERAAAARHPAAPGRRRASRRSSRCAARSSSTSPTSSRSTPTRSRWATGCSRIRATRRADRSGRRPRARTSGSSTRCTSGCRGCGMTVHGIGAWPDPPVVDAERGLRAARVVGAADERVLHGRGLRAGRRRVHPALRRAPPRRRARDRRHRRQGRRARAARRARRDQPRAALGDRLQVPARAGQHEAARHRRLGRPHRARDAVRGDGAGARRGQRRAAGDAAQPGRRARPRAC